MQISTVPLQEPALTRDFHPNVRVSTHFWELFYAQPLACAEAPSSQQRVRNLRLLLNWRREGFVWTTHPRRLWRGPNAPAEGQLSKLKQTKKPEVSFDLEPLNWDWARKHGVPNMPFFVCSNNKLFSTKEHSSWLGCPPNGLTSTFQQFYILMICVKWVHFSLTFILRYLTLISFFGASFLCKGSFGSDDGPQTLLLLKTCMRKTVEHKRSVGACLLV